MIEGGWICRACWKSNGPRDTRCYRCHTPREEQAAVEAGSLQARTKPGWELIGRLDADLPVLTLVTVLQMRIYSALGIGLGVLVFLLGLVNGGEGAPEVFGMPANVFIMLFGVITVIAGFLLVFLTGGLRRHARWAYGVTAVVFTGDSLLRISGFTVPTMTGGPGFVAWHVSAWVSLVVGVGAAALLVTSFIRRPGA